MIFLMPIVYLDAPLSWNIIMVSNYKKITDTENVQHWNQIVSVMDDYNGPANVHKEWNV